MDVWDDSFVSGTKELLSVLVEQSVTTSNIDRLWTTTKGMDGRQQGMDAIDINQETTAAALSCVAMFHTLGNTSRQSSVDKVHLVSHLRSFSFFLFGFIFQRIE